MATDLRQAPAYAAYMKTLGWQATDGAFIKKLPVLPISIIKIQRPKRLPNLAALKNFRPFYICVEPKHGSKSPKGFKPTTPLLPSKTIWLNLKQRFPRLLAGMHPKTRYNIGKHKLPVKILRGDKIDKQTLTQFFNIYHDNSRAQHFWGLNFNQLKNLINSFGSKAYLLWLPGRAGLVILIHDKVAYYSHNGSNKTGRQQFAPTILTWEAIKLAKKLGCHTFDLEGVTDERYPLTQKWQGFTRFKQGFGGRKIKYPGAFSKWLLP